MNHLRHCIILLILSFSVFAQSSLTHEISEHYFATQSYDFDYSQLLVQYKGIEDKDQISISARIYQDSKNRVLPCKGLRDNHTFYYKEVAYICTNAGSKLLINQGDSGFVSFNNYEFFELNEDENQSQNSSSPLPQYLSNYKTYGDEFHTYTKSFDELHPDTIFTVTIAGQYLYVIRDQSNHSLNQYMSDSKNGLKQITSESKYFISNLKELLASHKYSNTLTSHGEFSILDYFHFIGKSFEEKEDNDRQLIVDSTKTNLNKFLWIYGES